jgi:hypothetical protein
MTTRVAALVVGISFLCAGTIARADSPLLHPSTRALAAADDEDPPPREDRRAVKKQPEKAVEAEDEAPVYKKWWFWALTAAVVGGTVIFGVATFKPADHPPKACMPGTVACFGDRRNPQ